VCGVLAYTLSYTCMVWYLIKHNIISASLSLVALEIIIHRLLQGALLEPSMVEIETRPQEFFIGSLNRD
jgi:hypothetical protein